jgi:hypothetical protein
MRGALVVLLLLAQPVRAQSTCDPQEVAELRTHLENESRKAHKWNVAWAAIFGTAAVGSAVVAVINPLPDLQNGLYVSAGKATVGALGRIVLPLRIPLPDATGDACTDLALLRKAVAEAARREKGNFYLNHAGGLVVNAAGAVILWKYGTLGQAGLSVATGYPVGLLSNYTAPRGSWHLYRERASTWNVGVVPQQNAWLLTVGGEL